MHTRTLIFAILLGVFSLAAQADNFSDGTVAFIKGDMKTALRIWQPLAIRGHRDAQYHLGYMYHTGTGVPHDEAKALNWFTKAANQGHGDASIQARIIKREYKKLN